jgi:hypothetical protein
VQLGFPAVLLLFLASVRRAGAAPRLGPASPLAPPQSAGSL